MFAHLTVLLPSFFSLCSGPDNLPPAFAALVHEWESVDAHALRVGMCVCVCVCVCLVSSLSPFVVVVLLSWS